jgi:putative flippase GtrA
LKFFINNNIQQIIEKNVRFLNMKDHAGLQLIKYILCGTIATIVDIFIFYLLALWVFPALKNNDIFFKVFTTFPPIRMTKYLIRNFVICAFIAFLISNIIAYILNIRFVFDSNPLLQHREILLFYILSGLSIAIGMFVGWIFIISGFSTTISYCAKTVTLFMVNFIGRKFYIFKQPIEKFE